MLILRNHSGERSGEDATFSEVGENCAIPRTPTIAELALNPVSESLLCPFCKNVIRNATSAYPCGDVYCRVCIERLMKDDNPTCIDCKDAIEVGHMSKCRPVEKQINALQVSCENGLSYNRLEGIFTRTGWSRQGCLAVVAFEDYNAHTQNCLFSLTKCPNSEDGCEVVIEKGGLEAHQLSCEFKAEVCKCGKKVLNGKKEEHLLECEAVQCPHAQFGCAAVLSVGELDDHLTKCPFEVVKSALYKPIAEKAYEECLINAVSKLQDLQVHTIQEEDTWKDHISLVETEVFEMFDSQTKHVPEDLREEMKKKLSTQLKASRYSTSISKSIATHSHASTLIRSRGSCGSLEQTSFTVGQIRDATNNFSEANLLGKGGFGSVYRGLLYGTPVAIKRLHDGGNQSEFEFEVDVLRRVRHPNIVLLMGCCPELNCIVSEFLPGGSLEDHLKPDSTYPPLTWVDRLRIGAEIASALLYMHKQNILHRDMKPANVLLDKNNNTKLADMGLAKLFEASVMASGIKGTIGYLDPHQLQTGELSRSSDVYALGLILLQLITGIPRVQSLHSVLQKCGPTTPTRDLGRSTEVFLKELDPRAGEWGRDQAIRAVRLAIACVERLPEHRPDLEFELQPQLYQIAHAAATGQWEVPITVTRTRSDPQELQRGRGWSPKGLGAPAVPKKAATAMSAPAGPKKAAAMSAPAGIKSGLGASVAKKSFWENKAWDAPPPPEASGGSDSGKEEEAEVVEVEEEEEVEDELEAITKARALKEEGDLKFGDEKFPEAHEIYWKAAMMLPETHSLRATLLCDCAASLSQVEPPDWSEVEKCCSMALVSDPENKTALLGRANAAAVLQKTKEALDDLKTLLELDPTNEEALKLQLDLGGSIEQYSVKLPPPLGNTSTGPENTSFISEFAGMDVFSSTFANPPTEAANEGTKAQSDSKASTSPQNPQNSNGKPQPATSGSTRDLNSKKDNNKDANSSYSSPQSLIIDYTGVHFGHFCDNCGAAPICGVRFISRIRNNYELCRVCMLNWPNAMSDFQAIPAPPTSDASFLQSIGYAGGYCVIQSQEQYLQLLHLASHYGNSAAQCDLGLAYQRGVSVVQNDVEAVRLFNLAAAQGFPDGQFLLGKCYAEGRGVRVDISVAVMLFRQAADQGHSAAQLQLTSMGY